MGISRKMFENTKGEKSDALNWRTGNTLTRWKRTKRQTVIHKTLHRKLKT